MKTSHCGQCPINATSRGFSCPWGEGTQRVLVVTDSLMPSDISFGQALSPYGPSGVVWRRALRSLGISPTEFAYTSVQRCWRGFPTQASVDHCVAAHWSEVEDVYNYKAILALGAEAAKLLTGLAGDKRKVADLRGFVLPSSKGVPVVVSYDPAEIMEGNMHLLGVLQRDIDTALLAAHSEAATAPLKNYIHNPTPAQCEAFLEKASDTFLPIALDIETNYKIVEKDELIGDGSRITQIQFSLGRDTALVLDYEPRYRDFIAEVLGSPNTKLTFNGWIFDLPKLEAEGYEVRGAREDLMWRFNFWQPDLPKNLQFVTSFFAPMALRPWKHLMHADMTAYGGADVDALQYIWHGLNDEMALVPGLAPAYERYVNQFWPLLEQMRDRGIPFSKERAFEFSEQLMGESRALFARIRAEVPPELHPVTKVYKKSPVKRAGVVELIDEKLHWKRFADKDDLEGEWIPYEWREIEGEQKIVKVDYFNPLSPPQVAALPRALKHKPLSESTGKADLLKMAKKYKAPIYKSIVDYREIKKLQSAYLRAWLPGEDGRIHATFTFGPATGQLAAKNPNVLTQVKRGTHAKGFRRCVAADAGHQLVELDMTAFHAKTLGFEAQDAAYMRLAALDIHSYVAAHFLKIEGVDYWLEMDDADLKDRLAWVKKNHEDVRNFKAKPAILGIGFGLGVNRLYAMNEDSFDSKSEAQRVVDTMRAAFPKIFAWQISIKEQALRDGYLQSRFGFIRRFYDALKFDPASGGYVNGSQAEACIAFLPANDAHAHLREILLVCEEKGYLKKYNLINVIHDAVLFHCPDALVEECVALMRHEMELPSDILVDPVVGHFQVGAEAMAGPDWASMKVIHL